MTCHRLTHRVFLACTALLMAVAVCLALPCPQARADEEHSKVATQAERTKARSVAVYGMTPIYGSDVNDGTWPVDVRSSSSFFKIRSAELIAKDGGMKVRITISSTSYALLYAGTGEEAAAAPYEDYIQFDESGRTFEIDVPALDAEFNCAAFSKARRKWYDRKLLVDASTLPAEAVKFKVPDYAYIEEALDAYGMPEGGPEAAGQDADTAANGVPSGTGTSSDAGTSSGNIFSGTTGSDAAVGELPPEAATVTEVGSIIVGEEPEAMPIDLPDGTYSIEVNMTGGSGRATVSSPTWLIVHNGRAYARLLWSSMYYDYMIVEETKYYNETNDGGNSTFTIPITAMDEVMPIVADTVAMGDPVEIDYELTFYSDTVGDRGAIPQEAAMQVLGLAAVVIVLGGIANYFFKKRKKRKKG